MSLRPLRLPPTSSGLGLRASPPRARPLESTNRLTWSAHTGAQQRRNKSRRPVNTPLLRGTDLDHPRPALPVVPLTPEHGAGKTAERRNLPVNTRSMRSHRDKIIVTKPIDNSGRRSSVRALSCLGDCRQVAVPELYALLVVACVQQQDNRRPLAARVARTRY